MATYKINLTLLDRLIIPAILPKAGGLVEQVTQRGITAKIEFTPEEVEEFEMQDAEKGVIFNPVKAKDIEIEFLQNEVDLLKKTANQLNEEHKITQENLDTVLKINNL